MAVKEMFKKGDLCLYGRSIPVLVLERIYRYSSGLNNHEREYDCLCLVYNKIYFLSKSSLSKI